MAAHLQVSLPGHIVRYPDVPAPHNPVGNHSGAVIHHIIQSREDHISLVYIGLGNLEFDPPDAIILIEAVATDEVLPVGPKDGSHAGILQIRAGNLLPLIVRETAQGYPGIGPASTIIIGRWIHRIVLDAVPHHKGEFVPAGTVHNIAVGRFLQVIPGRISAVFTTVGQVARIGGRAYTSPGTQPFSNGFLIVFGVVQRGGFADKTHLFRTAAFSRKGLQPVVIAVFQLHALCQACIGINGPDGPGNIGLHAILVHLIAAYLKCIFQRTLRHVHLYERDFFPAGHGGGSTRRRKHAHLVSVLNLRNQISHHRSGMPGGSGQKVGEGEGFRGTAPVTDFHGNLRPVREYLRHKQQHFSRRFSFRGITRIGSRRILPAPLTGEEIVVSLAIDSRDGYLAKGISFFRLETHSGKGMPEQEGNGLGLGRRIVVQCAGSGHQDILFPTGRNVLQQVSVQLGRQRIGHKGIETHIADISRLSPAMAIPRPAKVSRPHAAFRSHFYGPGIEGLLPLGSGMSVGESPETASDGGHGSSFGGAFKRAGSGLETDMGIRSHILFLNTGGSQNKQYEGPLPHCPVTQ